MRTIKLYVPLVFFAIVTIMWLVDLRDEVTDPFLSLAMLAVVYAIGAWVLWRPFGLKIADFVEDRAGNLFIRRGKVEVEVSYTDIQNLEYIRIGAGMGVRLTFARPNLLGDRIGFHQAVKLEGKSDMDAIEYIQRRIKSAQNCDVLN